MKACCRLMVVGFAFCFSAVACVSGDPVTGGAGGRRGAGGSNGSGQGGSTFSGQGGFIAGGQGGAPVAGGQGGAIVAGGQGGTSTSTGCPRSDVLIDNFDEPVRGGPATGAYFNLNCGVGSWYVYGDPTATATVTPPLSTITPFTSSTPGHGGAGYAAHVNGSGFAMYGVGLGVNINSSGATIKTADASAYSGFTFWIMGTASGTTGANMVRVAVPIPASSIPANGGTCAGSTVPPTTYCEGHWGKVIPVTSTWTQQTIKWSELTLEAGGSVGGTAFTPASVIGFHWQASATAAMPASMNIWVDDLAFVP